jgi:hypothetical protein
VRTCVCRRVCMCIYFALCALRVGFPLAHARETHYVLFFTPADAWSRNTPCASVTHCVTLAGCEYAAHQHPRATVTVRHPDSGPLHQIVTKRGRPTLQNSSSTTRGLLLPPPLFKSFYL